MGSQREGNEGRCAGRTSKGSRDKYKEKERTKGEKIGLLRKIR